MVFQEEKKSGGASIKGGYAPTNLLCEYTSNPLGIDVALPRFSWVLNHPDRGQLQSAYQVLVASSQLNLHGDKWDSGKVTSEQSINVVYAGSALESGKTYYWKVRIWDKDGQVSPYSKTATFEMGLLKPEDWQAQWIGCPGGRNGRGLLLRKEFSLEKNVARARVYISGLGYYELRINGTRVGDHVLDPGWTEYSKRILYVTYDVTSCLKKGANAVGVILGNGWYGSPKMIFQMKVDFTDGTSMSIMSDHSWKVASSPITANSIYDGETYDARLEKPGWDTADYDDSSPRDWMTVMRVESPGGVMVAQMLEPIKVVETIEPVAITNPKPGVYVYDMGQNMVGWARINVKGPAGSTVVLKFAELLYEDGTVNQENIRSALATDTYILKGEGREVYEPRFTYHGFRYVQVTGFPDEPKLENLQGRVVHSAVEPVGSFTTSHALLNQIQKNILWGQSGNLHSVPTDCPQRNERLGWMGDVTVTAEEAIYNFNMPCFYSKWLNDIQDAQDKKTGSIPDTAPYRWGREPGDPAWAGVYLLLPWYLYQYYGDRRILEQHYTGMKQWVDFLGTKASDYIVSYCHYGDWCSPGHIFPKNTPGALTSTAYYYYGAWTLSRVAQVLGKSEEADKYSKLAHQIKEAFNNQFLNKDTNQYATGSQCSNAFPLFLGLVPEANKTAVLENLVKDIMVNHQGHLDTGILGTKYMMEALTDYGRTDVAYTIATQTTYPGWGYMISKGATTIWERWEQLTGPGMNSHNHPMFGSVGAWFYKTLAGIKVDPEGPGYRRIIIKPQVVGDLNYVNASVKTVRGRVSSSWKKNKNSLNLKLSLPVNSQAKVSIPKLGLDNVTVKESGKTIWKNNSYVGGVAGITKGSENDEYVTFEVGSGSYSFELSGTTPPEIR